MLQDLIMDLVCAVDKREREKAYRRLERIGVDRMTADVMASEFTNGGKKDEKPAATSN